MKWSVGDKVLYEYRPRKGGFAGKDRDYYGEIVNINNNNGHAEVIIKFDTIPEMCSYRLDDFVMKVLKLVDNKFEDNNPNKTFREKHVGK